MKNSGLREPEFYDNGFFRVVLRGPDGELVYNKNSDNLIDLSEYGLNECQLIAFIEMVNNNLTYTYKTYSEKFNVSISTSKRDLNELVEKQLIDKNKEGRSNSFNI